jgi:hypothetical protein
MRHRRYGDYADLRHAAMEILEDILFYGASAGWEGDQHEVDELTRLLSPMNVVLTDPEIGEWEVRGPRIHNGLRRRAPRLSEALGD